MNIRRGNIKDYDDVLKLLGQLEEAEVKFDNNLRIGYFDTEEGKIATKKAIRKRNVIFLVAENNNSQVVGFVLGKVSKKVWWNCRPVGFIDDVVVDSNYRQQGIGQMLLLEFEKIAKRQGASYIRLLAFPSNFPAVNFYKKDGFSEYSVYYQKEI